MEPGIVVMGVSGSGKSRVGAALAEALGFAFVDGDDLHPPASIAKMAGGTPLTDADRAGWLDAVAARVRPGVVVACSALKRAYRDRIRDGAAGRVVFVHLSGSRALLEARLARRRGHFMPPGLLESQLATLEPPGDDEDAITVNIAPDPANIVQMIRNRLESGLTD